MPEKYAAGNLAGPLCVGAIAIDTITGSIHDMVIRQLIRIVTSALCRIISNPPIMHIMNNKVVLIAGGTGGIGSATAKLFAKTGAKIVLAARNREKADAIAAEINESGGEAYAVDLDVTDASSVQKMAETVVGELGRIDVLVNAFGTGMIKGIAEAEPEKAKHVLDVNVYGTILVTQAVLRHMMAEKSGKVIMLPGILGKHVMRNTSIYSASKFAVAGFTKALVEETRRYGIGFTLLYLGGVATEFWENPDVEMKVQSDKMLVPEEVAKAVYYAVSQPAPGVLNEMVIQPDSHQMV